MKVFSDKFGGRAPWIVAATAVILALGWAAQAGESAGTWTQFGGDNQDFKADSTGLADSWPEDGPKKLWSRELGEGYSAILVEDGSLYTMYRTDDKESVIRLDAKTGETIWEHKYDHSPAEGHVHQFGDGPRSTPLLVGDRLFTVGIAGRMHALNKKDGKVLWSHDLWADFGGSVLQHGYSSSPIEYGKTVIVLVGGEEKSIVAFNMKSGKVAWATQSFKNSYSTPKIFKLNGKEQLVTFMAHELVGIDPGTGALLWRYEFANQFEQNINMPVLADNDVLFMSSPQVGARGVKISQEGDEAEIEEVWSSRKIQFYHAATVQIGDYVYGSTGTMAPAFMAAINIKTGEIPWRKRGFAKANCVSADGRMIVLDEDGVLYLTTATPDDLEVHSQVDLLEDVAWTVPTIVGKTMYVRDKVTIQALDLG
jgi:outer membrane protein assembly factor BamB